MCSYWLRTWRHTCTLHLHTPFAYAIITKTSYAFFAKITLCIFYPMTPFAHAFAYAIKKTPYAFFAKITLCMYILCDINMFKNEEYSSFLNIFTKKTKFTILLIYKFYIPISTFRVSYKATIVFNVLVVIDKIKRRSQLESSNFCPELRNPPIIF